MPTAIYKPVSGDAAAGDGDGAVVFDFDDDGGNGVRQGSSAGASGGTTTSISDENGIALPPEDLEDEHFQIVQPMEISSSSFDDDFSEQLFGWKDPWLPTVLLILLLVVPVQVATIGIFYGLLGAWFAATPFALHLVIVLCTARHLTGSKLPVLQGSASRIYTSVAAGVDDAVLGVVYPLVYGVIAEQFFTDLDGTAVVEWSGYRHRFEYCTTLAVTATVDEVFSRSQRDRAPRGHRGDGFRVRRPTDVGRSLVPSAHARPVSLLVFGQSIAEVVSVLQRHCFATQAHTTELQLAVEHCPNSCLWSAIYLHLFRC